jgi:hypothetical protein
MSAPEPWTTVVRKKRPNSSQKRADVRAAAKEMRTVVGTGSAEAQVKACPTIKQIFVSKVDRDVKPAAMRALMKKKGVSPIDIRLLSKEAWLSASFKIAVPALTSRKPYRKGFGREVSTAANG